MTDALKRAVRKAEMLPEPKQQVLAVVINDKVEELREAMETEAMARLAESSFAQDWDNEEDDVYNNWKALYGVSEG
jgi:hypothetical protein